jgi:hypothetical protein
VPERRLLSLTIVWRDWIEILFGVDPDNHSGSLEWLIALGCLALVIALGFLARRERRALSSRRPPRSAEGGATLSSRSRVTSSL